VRFDPLGEAHLRSILVRHGRTPEEAAASAALAGGSAERALTLDVARVRTTRDRIVQEVWGALRSLPGILDRAESLAKDRAGLDEALEILASFSRDLAVARASGGNGPVVHGDRRAEVVRLASEHSTEALIQVFKAQVEAQRALARHANPRLTAERMLLRMRDAIHGGQEGVHGAHRSH